MMCFIQFFMFMVGFLGDVVYLLCLPIFFEVLWLVRVFLVCCLVFVFLSQSAYAVECPPGFTWKRMSGVGCVQSDCVQVGGSYTY